MNSSNIKIVCRIKPPKSYESGKESRKLATTSPMSKHYTAIRNRSGSNSTREMTSPSSNSNII
jgi:hypothetical protein